MRVTKPETNKQVINYRLGNAITILMIMLGSIAIAFPLFATVASTLVFGWIFVFAGTTQIVYAFTSRGAGRVAWKLILGFLYLIAGIIVVVNPLKGVIAFTIVLGITIFMQGIIQILIAFQMRWVSPTWKWMLVSGLVGIIFGIVVRSISPFGAASLIGTLIGINLLFDGVWMLSLHSAQQRALD